MRILRVKAILLKTQKAIPVEYYWEERLFIDFSNLRLVNGGKNRLKYYFDHGCEGIWNDNNELELEDSELPHTTRPYVL